MRNPIQTVHSGLRRQFRDETFHRSLALVKGDILEVGSGSRSNLGAYQMASSVTLLDAHIRSCHWEHINVQTPLKVIAYEANIARLPFRDDSFDAFVASFFFCCVEDIPAAVRELSRVCKPAAKCILLEHVKSERRLIRALQWAFSPLQSALRDGCRLDCDPSVYLRDGGWDISVQKRTSHTIPWMFLEGSNSKTSHRYAATAK